jgi:hypothetical protein
MRGTAYVGIIDHQKIFFRIRSIGVVASICSQGTENQEADRRSDRCFHNDAMHQACTHRGWRNRREQLRSLPAGGHRRGSGQASTFSLPRRRTGSSLWANDRRTSVQAGVEVAIFQIAGKQPRRCVEDHTRARSGHELLRRRSQDLNVSLAASCETRVRRYVARFGLPDVIHAHDREPAGAPTGNGLDPHRARRAFRT